MNQYLKHAGNAVLSIYRPVKVRFFYSLAILSTLAAFATTAVYADNPPAAGTNQSEPERKHGFSLYVDQDFFIPARNEDRDYTMGFALELFWEKIPEEVDYLDRAITWLDQNATGGLLAKSIAPTTRSIMLGSVNFTPDDLAASAPLSDDRPYASLLFVSGKQMFESSNKEWVIGSELQVGLLGLGIARSAQTKMHGYTRSLTGEDTPVDPKGWSHQISDGGELTFKYHQSFGQELVNEDAFDIAWTTDASVGYQTNASLGVQLRVGRRDSKFWTLPYDPVNRGNFVPSTKGDELYVWAAFRGRGVVYDALLQGQFRESDVTFSSGEIKRFVQEGGVGLTAAWKPIQITLALNYKSAELEGQAARSHYWGGTYFIFRW